MVAKQVNKKNTGKQRVLAINALDGSFHLSCKRDQIKMRDYMDRRVTPPKRVTSPTWGPPPPCKQALRELTIILMSLISYVLKTIYKYFSNITIF